MSAVFAANDITAAIVTLPILIYLRHKNKAVWTGIGQLIGAVANFFPLIAYIIVPRTDTITEENSNSSRTTDEKENYLFLSSEANSTTNCVSANVKNTSMPYTSGNRALIFFFFKNLLNGFAVISYWSLGINRLLLRKVISYFRHSLYGRFPSIMSNANSYQPLLHIWVCGKLSGVSPGCSLYGVDGWSLVARMANNEHYPMCTFNNLNVLPFQCQSIWTSGKKIHHE